MRLFKQLFQLILNTLFPPVCTFCKAEGDLLCKNCVQNFKKKVIQNKRVKEPNEFTYLNGLIYGLDYAENPAIQAALKQFKYKFNQDLSIYFGDLLAEKLNELQMTAHRKVILIPVPLHKKRLAERGFNQSEIICSAIRKNKPEIQILNLLQRSRYTDQQAKLNRAQRLDNLQCAFIMNKKIVHNYNPKNIYFLVDDVCTTGSTLESCGRVLKMNGFNKVYGLVVARAFK